MRKWRMKVGDLGFDLSDGMPPLIDLRFAEDILLFARSAMEVRKLLDSLVAELSKVGLLLNADSLLLLCFAPVCHGAAAHLGHRG